MRKFPLLLARTVGGRLLAVGVSNYHVKILFVELLALGNTREEVRVAAVASDVDGIVCSDAALH